MSSSLPAMPPHFPLSLPLTPTLLLTTLTLFLLYHLLTALHTIYLHPLSLHPGYSSWIAFPILPRIYALFGTMDAQILSLHALHGPIVRVSANELSFTTKQAWDDIYGYRVIPQLPKPNRRDPKRAPAIVNANDADHTRFRKALAHGFGERALKSQEPLIMGYVDLLVERLRAVAREGKETNMVKWYNYTTFDIIGDLSFGQSFDCLNSSTYHNWVLNVFHLIENAPLTFGKLVYPVSFKLLGLLVTPKKVRGSRDYQTQLVKERLESRMNNESQKGRCDFVDSMMRHQGDRDEISFDEMVENASILVVAGSETTATLLSGVTYYLCKTPRVYEKVKEEVRSKFRAEEDITFASIVECEYMLAVLEEGLRIYPPAPSVFPRQALEDMVVDGVRVPKGTHVGVHQLATYRAQENWSRPDDFVPERWTKQGKGGEFRDDHRDALQPFVVGPRNCIGRNLAMAEMRTILAKMLWNFDFELCAQSERWSDQKIKTLWLKPELMCKVKVRNGLENVDRD